MARDRDFETPAWVFRLILGGACLWWFGHMLAAAVQR